MNTDLFDVLRRNSIRQVKLVLEAGYDVNARNERLETPLMACVMHIHDPDCRMRVIKLLIGAGADVNIQNGRGQTVTMYACILNQTDTLLQLLQDTELDLNNTDTDGNTALMYACALGYAEVASALVEGHRVGEHYLELQKKNCDGLTAVEHAAGAGHFDIVKMLSSFTGNSDSIGLGAIPPNCDWSEEVGPTSSPTPNAKQPHEKMQQFIQDVQKASFENDENRIQHNPFCDRTSPKGMISGHVSPRHQLEVGENEERQRDRASAGSRLSGVSSFRSVSQQSRKKPVINRQTYEQYSDDDDEFSLASLGELVSTVRECAKEIREIYVPINEDIQVRQARGYKSGKKVRNNRKGKSKINSRALDSHAEQKRRKTPDIKLTPGKQIGKTVVICEIDPLSQTWPQKSSSSLSVGMSASSISEERELAVPSTYLSISSKHGNSPRLSRSPTGEPVDKTFHQEKQILNKVFGRLSSYKDLFGPYPGPNSDSNDTRKGRSVVKSKANMMARDQFSTYGNPLPSIPRPKGNLPPVPDEDRYATVSRKQENKQISHCALFVPDEDA